jgi:hypothetical protein
MFISPLQLAASLDALKNIHPFFGMSFLAFKEKRIPVGETRQLNFSLAADEILERHYRPSSSYAGFYNPFVTSRRHDRWLKPRYGSTSLQRITKDTFGDALLHPREQEWGWRPNYIRVLRDKHLKKKPISAFHLAIWLFREHEWPTRATPRFIQNWLFDKYQITSSERDALFEDRSAIALPGWRSDRPISEAQLLEIIGPPAGKPPPAGAALRSLSLRGVGPALRFNYEPADRLNIITGDNSLGKTFLLDCIWWALTGSWVAEPAYPRPDVPKRYPSIGVRVGTLSAGPQSFTVGYDWDAQDWERPPKRRILSGLAVYARHDGSFAVWDPSRVDANPAHQRQSSQSLLFSRDEVWKGLNVAPLDREKRIVCNGLLADWVLWQVGGSRYERQFSALTRCLGKLSPSDDERLELGEPMRLREAREIPTLKMPYGDVPVTLASAAVQRIIALAYMLVWTWSEHLQNSETSRRPPQKAMVLIVDEVEAHLHPRWQRVIVPSLVQVVQDLAPEVAVQSHLATHSAMVMTSTEPIFNKEVDDLHHLKLVDRQVVLEELPFIKRGTADAWLMSNVFGLAQPRSREAESAIEDAKSVQLGNKIRASAVREVNARLIRFLAADDEFWPRWRFFAKKYEKGS